MNYTNDANVNSTPRSTNTRRRRHSILAPTFWTSQHRKPALTFAVCFFAIIIGTSALGTQANTLNFQAEHYEDPTDILSAHQLLSPLYSNVFKPLPSTATLHAGKNHWIRINVPRTTQYPFIRFSLPGEQTLNAYLTTASGSTFALPKVRPITIPFSHQQYFLELPRTSTPAVILIKIKTSVSTRFDAIFSTTNPRLNSSIGYVFSGFLIAGMLLLAAAKSCLGYIHKKATLFMSSTLVMLLLANNIFPFTIERLTASNVLATSIEWMTIIVDFMAVGIAAAVSLKLLSTFKRGLSLSWLASVALAVSSAIGMIALPLIGEISGKTLANLLLVSASIVFTCLTLPLARSKRSQPAAWWFASWTPLCALSLIAWRPLQISLTQAWPWLSMIAWALFVAAQIAFLIQLHRFINQTQTQQIEKTLTNQQTQIDILTREHAKSETLLANMGYELREPLNSIVGAIDQLKDTISSTPDNLAAMGILHRGSLRLQMLVDELVDYMDIEEGHLKASHRCFHLGNMLDQVIQTFADQAEQRGLKLRTQFGEDVPPFVIGDEVRLKQLLGSLVDNALKFTPQGKVAIHINAKAYNRRTRHVNLRFLVEDTGIGIPDQCEHQVFGRFERVDHPAHRRYSGLGVGMYTAKIMAEHLGGQLTYSSLAKQGSIFIFDVSMPYVDVPDIYDPANMTRHPPLSTESFTVLIVEDNPSSQMIIRMMTEKLGYQTMVANSAKEALSIIEQTPPHLILMDCQMPEMDGYEATQAIRDMPSPASQIPILAVTAEAGAQARQRCQEAGMNGYLQKPVRILQLENKIAQLLLQAKFVRGNVIKT